METVIKTFVGLFFTMLLLILGIGMIAASVNARNAASFAADCTAQIENSDFSESVIESCGEEAEDRGYKLTVEVMSQETKPENKFGSLQLEYPFRIPLIGVGQQNVVVHSIR